MRLPAAYRLETAVSDGILIGRERELAAIDAALAGVRSGAGGMLLVAGEAGVGKTRLLKDALGASGLHVLLGEAAEEATPAYGPVVAALRSHLRSEPDALRYGGPLSRYLALVLPELGPRPQQTDRATLFEAIRCAFEAVGRHEPCVVLLDDLHWADDATLGLLPALASALEQEPVLVIGSYRSDELRRGHPIRRLRAELRRGRRLRELVVEPLDAIQTAALAEQLLGRPAAPALAAMLHDRSQGVPFFIEELVDALKGSDVLVGGGGTLEVVRRADLPLPETVRDAVLLRAERLSAIAREALEVAAVAGVRFDLGLVVELAGADGFEEAMRSGFVVEDASGRGVFRHALTRDAIYGAVTWTRRRSLHAAIAARLESSRASPGAVAEHWLAAQQPARARPALLAAADAYAAVHAHRDAARTLQRAAELWPAGEDESARLAALDRLGDYAELSGDFGGATRAWREGADAHSRRGDVLGLATTERKLAALYELECAWEAAYAARALAAESFDAAGRPGEAAAERLAAAGNLQSAGSLSAALELVIQASDEAERAVRVDLKARALGFEGLVRARMGDVEAGLASARAALSLALAENLIEPAAEAYEKVGMVLDLGAEHGGAIDAFTTAFDFCQAHGVAGRAKICLGCLAYVLRKTGEWDRVIEIHRDVTAESGTPRNARCAAIGELGLVHVLRGDTKRARAPLTEAFALAQQSGFMIMKLESACGLARLEEQEGNSAPAEARCHLLIELARAGEDNRYPVPALRWATTFFASRGAEAEAGACAEWLATAAARSGNAEAAAAAAHALAEMALLNGDAEQAAHLFLHALELLRELELPFDRAETQLRAGTALATAGEREPAVERLTDAYRTARKLGARPLAARARSELGRLGEPADRRRAKHGAAEAANGGLSRRELEIVRLVAVGRTNREIGIDLFLSTRTVDMHVRNILTKLGCRSRADATRRAAELGLLA